MWPIIIMYFLLIPCVTMFIQAKHKGKETVSIILKALSTGIIVLTGIYGMLHSDGGVGIYAPLIVLGLTMGLLGDVAICKSFILGALFFALGHIAYICAILRVTTHALLAIPIFIVIGLLIFTIYKKSKIDLGALKIPATIYCLIILTMVSLAATMPFTVFPKGLLLPIGAGLFAASDAMLAMNKFSDKLSVGLASVDRYNFRGTSNDRFSQKLDTISLFCYYFGQSFFAVSIFFYSNIMA